VNANQLHVVTAISNPVAWKSRIALYNAFEQHMLDSGVQLTTVECSYGDHDPEISINPKVNHVRVKATGVHKVWIKENLLNLGIQRLPSNAKYIATIDADVTFRDPKWALATLDALQHFHVIQPWAYCYDLGPKGEHLATHRSFANLFYAKGATGIHQGPNAVGGYEFGHPGYAWAYTRQALEWGGGLIEIAALGAADHHMALALIGKVGDSIHGGMTGGYKAPLYQWQGRMYPQIAGHVGSLAGTIEHGWHGQKAKRAYVDRWEILIKNKFDPATDLKKNTWGVLELAGNKPQLSHDIDAYFRSGDEDSNSLG
jgi:hypothetical protein